MKSASIRDFRARLAEFLEGREPVLVTRHGRNVAIVYPLREDRGVTRSVLVERYKRDVDRTLIRENLRRTPEERLRALQQMQRFADELRRARAARR